MGSTSIFMNFYRTLMNQSNKNTVGMVKTRSCRLHHEPARRSGAETGNGVTSLKISFILPVIVIIIALLDILPSITFLIVIQKPDVISDFTTCFIDGSYILRSIFIYLEFLWIISAGLFLLIKYSKRRMDNSGNAR